MSSVSVPMFVRVCVHPWARLLGKSHHVLEFCFTCRISVLLGDLIVKVWPFDFSHPLLAHLMINLDPDVHRPALGKMC